MSTIKISKAQWEFIGKKAGWMKRQAISDEDLAKVLQRGQGYSYPEAVSPDATDPKLNAISSNVFSTCSGVA